MIRSRASTFCCSVASFVPPAIPAFRSSCFSVASVMTTPKRLHRLVVADDRRGQQVDGLGLGRVLEARQIDPELRERPRIVERLAAREAERHEGVLQRREVALDVERRAADRLGVLARPGARLAGEVAEHRLELRAELLGVRRGAEEARADAPGAAGGQRHEGEAERRRPAPGLLHLAPGRAPAAPGADRGALAGDAEAIELLPGKADLANQAGRVGAEAEGDVEVRHRP